MTASESSRCGRIAGTSAGSPQWASFMAIANQCHAVAGKAALDGATEELPLLYGFYNTATAAGVPNYGLYFNDVPGTGYDTATGLGSPKVPATQG